MKREKNKQKYVIYEKVVSYDWDSMLILWIFYFGAWFLQWSYIILNHIDMAVIGFSLITYLISSLFFLTLIWETQEKFAEYSVKEKEIELKLIKNVKQDYISKR